MKKIICLITIFYIAVFNIRSQINGNVIDEHDQSIEFANVVLYVLPDSIMINGTVTDSLGNFTIPYSNLENTFLKVSMMGYQTEIVATKPYQTIIMYASEVQLKEITVSAQMIRSFAARDDLIIPASIKNKSASALSALGQMPQFRLNVLTNILETADHQKIKILINGVNASEQELMSIASKDIRRIEYYTQPPARYANMNVGAVIDIVTAVPDSVGFSGMLNTKNSFTTGYGTNTLNTKWYNERNQLTLMYFIDYRNLNDNRIHQDFEYAVDGEQYKNTYEGQPGSYKGEYHIFQTNYIHQKTDDYMFSGKISYRLNPGNEKYTQFTSVIQNNSEPILGTASKNLKSDYNSVAGDIYFNKILPKGQEFIANLVGTNYKSTSKNELSRTLSSEAGNYMYTNNVENTSNSVIAEVLYNRQFTKQHFTAGGRYLYKDLQQVYNSADEFILSQQIMYAYSGLSGSAENVSYSLELGLEHSIQSTSDRVKPTRFSVVKPSLSINYAFNSKSSIRLNSAILSTMPEISLMTTNPIYLNYKYASIGNPDLKPYYTVYNRLQYQLNLPKFYFSTSVRNSYLVKPYLVTFQERDTEIIRTWEFKKKMSYYGVDMNIRWTPFDWLTLQPYATVVYSKFTNNDNSMADDVSKMLSLSTTLSYNNFRLLSQWGSAFTNLQGDYVEKRMTYYVSELSWAKNQITIALQYIHNPHPVITYSNNEILLFREETIWNNFRNLIAVSFVYSFSKGKKNTIRDDKRLNNQDNDSGLRKDVIAK